MLTLTFRNARWTNISKLSSKPLLKPARSWQALSYTGNSEIKKKWCTCAAPVHLIHCREEQTCEFGHSTESSEVCAPSAPSCNSLVPWDPTCAPEACSLHTEFLRVRHNRATIPETSRCSCDTNKGKKRSNAFDCIATLITGLLNFPMHMCSLNSWCEILQGWGNCTAKAFVIQECWLYR